MSCVLYSAKEIATVWNVFYQDRHSMSDHYEAILRQKVREFMYINQIAYNSRYTRSTRNPTDQDLLDRWAEFELLSSTKHKIKPIPMPIGKAEKPEELYEFVLRELYLWPYNCNEDGVTHGQINKVEALAFALYKNIVKRPLLNGWRIDI